MSTRDDANARWLALCDSAALQPAACAAGAALRREGRAAFASAGLPHSRLEEWRYTSVEPLLKSAFALPAAAARTITRDELEELAAPLFACDLVVFANGQRHPELGGLSASGPKVASFSTLCAAPSGKLGALVDLKLHPLAALASALLGDGLQVHAPAGASFPQPLHVVFAATPSDPAAISTPRLVIDAAPGSTVVVIQDHVAARGSGAHFTNAITEVFVGEGASVELVLLQRESAQSLHASLVAARLAQGARFASHVVTLGGRFVRNDLQVLLAEPGAECSLSGLFLGTGERLVDNHTFVDHAVPHCTSRELYKGVLAGSSRGVFRGRVVVRPDAQKTDAKQSSANLLLSDLAEVDAKPQLEIYADDVKCSHGSSIGRVDEDALFYLRSRGLDARAATALLTQGFAAEVLNALPAPALGETLLAAFGDALPAEEIA